MSGRSAAGAAVLERAVPSVRRRTPALLFGVLADACVVGLLGLSMWLIARTGEQPPILHLTFAIVGVRALAIGRAAFRYAERLSSHDAVLAQLATLRSQTFASLIPRIPGALDSRRRGDVLATFVDDVDQLQDEAVRVRQPLLVSGIVVGLSLVTVALFSVAAALVLTLVLVASGVVSIQLAQRLAGEYDRDLAGARAGLMDALLDRFSAAEVLAAFGATGAQRARITDAEKRLARVQLRRARSAGLTGALLSLGSGAASLLVLIVVLPQVGPGVSAPVFAALVVVPAAVFEVFAQVPNALAARRVVRSSADRIAELSETPIPSVIPREGPEATEGRESAAFAVAADPVAPLIDVRDLSARHPGQTSDAVSGLSFALRPGETLVISGPSGSGKSTIAAVLVGFLAYQGSLRVRGIEAREMRPSELRRTVGLCEQDPHLFDADLRQNLKFASASLRADEAGEGADDEVLFTALERVGLADWTRERGGLGSAVGERGALVSGGQAQRIALARAILADFPVVVLDEPTAGVDRELADRLLLDLIGAVPSDRAVILITHTEVPTGIEAMRLSL